MTFPVHKEDLTVMDALEKQPQKQETTNSDLQSKMITSKTVNLFFLALCYGPFLFF